MVEETGVPGKNHHITLSHWQLSHLPWAVVRECLLLNYSFIIYRVRGLGQLVRARNIRTIGHLSSLTEYEVHNLPIRSPKVSTVRKVLKTYEQQLSSKKTKETTVSLETMLEDHGKEKENGRFFVLF